MSCLQLLGLENFIRANILNAWFTLFCFITGCHLEAMGLVCSFLLNALTAP